jgi:hypothetical protein
MQNGNILEKFRLRFDPNHKPNRMDIENAAIKSMPVHDLNRRLGKSWGAAISTSGWGTLD